MEEFFGVPIVIPSIEEQENTIQIFDKQQSQVDQLVDSARKLRSLKAGLMHDLLTGKIRVTKLLASQTSQE
jgi:type I restriction enzyme S subunit